MNIIRLSVFFCLLLPVWSFAQDLHYSQFYLHPLHFNPAQTGNFQGMWRAGGIYRGQWASVPVNYRSFGGSFDYKLRQGETQTQALGLTLQHDEAGDGGLNWTQIGLSGAWAQALSETQTIAAGFGLSVVQRSVDLSGLRFKNQWNGDVLDPSAPSGELLNRNSGLSPSLSAGVNWHYQNPDSRNGADLGLGAAHLNRPRINFADDEKQQLPMRFVVSARGVLQMTEQTDLVGFGLGQLMDQNREIIAGAGLRRWLDPLTALQFSLAWRVGDAVVPAVQLERDSWTFGLSYDWNISAFDQATRGRGGIELTAVYRALPAPPVKTLKTCPVF